MLTSETTFRGAQGEDRACAYLQHEGFRILDRNWRRPWGEIDIVAERNGTLHFIEVKTSARNIPGFEPFLRANQRKMHIVRRTAQTWLSAHHSSPAQEWQLDIISVIMDPQSPEIELFEHAA